MIRNKLIKRLEELTKCAAPSNFELSFQTKYKEELQPLCNGIQIDQIGNVIASKTNNNDSSIMMTAHSDEVGFIITHINDAGFLYIRNIGYIEPRIVECQHMDIFHNGNIIEGVVGRSYGRDKKVETISDLWVDIGANSKEDALRIVSVGDYAVFHSKLTVLENGHIAGKSLDNKAGLVVIEEVFRQLSPTKHDLYMVASVQEETGCRGGAVAAHRIRPSICIVVDVTFATDYPTSDPKEQGDIRIGKGVVIPFGANVNNSLQSTLKEIATENGISYQAEALSTSSGTDAKTIQIVGDGIDTCLLSIPCRYMHSPVEVVSIFDMEQAVNLIISFISKVEMAQIH